MKLSSDMWKNTYFVRIKFYFFATAKVKIVKIKRSFINVWRKNVFDIYFTEFGTALTTVLPILFLYCYKYCYSDNRNESGRFDALKPDSTHHFFRNACTKSGSLRFSQFSGCWLILSVYIIKSFVRSSVILLLPLFIFINPKLIKKMWNLVIANLSYLMDLVNEWQYTIICPVFEGHTKYVLQFNHTSISFLIYLPT